MLSFNPRLTGVRSNLADFKLMLIITFYRNRVLAYKIMPRRQTVNGDQFLIFLRDTLWPTVRENRIYRSIILMDNARPHSSPKINDFMRLRRWERLEHPAYSPDINPCDFDSIMRIKRPLKGRRFANENELIEALRESIIEVSKSRDFKGITNLPKQWNKIMTENGDYVV